MQTMNRTRGMRANARLLFALLVGLLLALGSGCGDSEDAATSGDSASSSEGESGSAVSTDSRSGETDTDEGAGSGDHESGSTDGESGSTPGTSGSASASNSEGSGAAPGPDPEVARMLKSTMERGAPDAPDADLRALVVGEADYALDLLRGIAAEGEDNIIFSSLSVRSAFAMLWAGAKGETADELAEALRFSLPAAEFHAAWNRLDQALASREDVALEGDDEPPRLRIVNDLWGLEGYPYVEAWLDVMAEFYGAGMWIVDFMRAPAAARDAINAYIGEVTNDRIPELLPEDAINADTRLVLTNAIWFKAGWAEPFVAEDTADETFTTTAGNSVDVPMMKRNDQLWAHEVDGHYLVEIPYVGHELSMVVLLPAAGELENLRDTLDGETLLGWMDEMSLEGLVDLWMPRFEMRSSVNLIPLLQDLGVEAVFNEGQADLSGLSETALEEGLHVTGAFHQGFIAVDEEGTEAAAATAILVGPTSAPMERFEVRLDRPFLYFIRDRVTGVILFAGQVGDPS